MGSLVLGKSVAKEPSGKSGTGATAGADLEHPRCGGRAVKGGDRLSRPPATVAVPSLPPQQLDPQALAPRGRRTCRLHALQLLAHLGRAHIVEGRRRWRHVGAADQGAHIEGEGRRRGWPPRTRRPRGRPPQRRFPPATPKPLPTAVTRLLARLALAITSMRLLVVDRANREGGRREMECARR